MVDLKRRVYSLFDRDIYLVLFLVFIFSSCSHLIKMPVDNPQTSAFINRAVDANGDLRTIKGKGRLRFTTDDGTLSAKIAWAAQMPDKIRIDILTPLGQSSLMLVADGHIVTFFSEGHSGRQLKQRKNALEPIVHVPVGIEFLTALLAGRLPSPSYVATRTTSNETNIAGIELLDRWSMLVGRLYADPVTQKPMHYNHYGPDGTDQYQISWREWEVTQGYSLPGYIEIKTVDGDILSLQMDRYFCNEDLANDMFSVPMTD